MSKNELTEIIRDVISKVKEQDEADARTMMCTFGDNCDVCDGVVRYAIMEDDSYYQPQKR